ncbi:NAD(P)H-dependent oxidoreductase subunit E [Azohydromonas sp.]|uniref:NAD(P)H-dependent oxidoreductase subunit E n=1 Tax=Azohydromonas sp. TaxID=1872666 RepID=UPI002CCF4A76|nr:NAD(P)H-dependent oxidoreductase subunit E [Azohydromonas sp.]HMM87055.1 NAD(P)H-dependent oxidoreductase subunit E [Azohydromonas sp.]
MPSAPRETAITVTDARQRKRAAPKGRQVDAQALAQVRALLGDAPRRRDLLIEHLHRLQDRFGHLSAAHLAALAQEMHLAQTEVYEVATFYHHFDIVREGEPAPPPLTVRVCDGLACELAGAKSLRAELEERCGRGVRIVGAPCVGRCEQAPVAVVHQHPVPSARADAVLATLAAGTTTHVHTGYVGFAAYCAGGGYALLERCRRGELDADAVIDLLEDSGLRGLGGAGFPAGRKWRLVGAQPAPRLLAVNIDEGEPGTFKDRWYLERDPHRFVEGALIAAWAVGIDAIYVYLRDEYHGLRAMLHDELDALRASTLGAHLPSIEVRRGAGAYVCGEESAMIESIEGKRGLPRLRPPYVAQVGLFGLPTLEHNFETLHWVREIVERGAGWFASHGRHGRRGLRSFSVSGRVRQPGVKLAPAGITLRELVDEHCGGLPDGHELYAWLPGGASGGIFPASMADLPLDFDTLQPHGGFIGSAAVIVLTRSATHCDRAVDAARNLMRFFRDESCGQCTPCRAGTAKASALIEADRWDLPLLADLSAVMRDASICGLGQAAPNPVDCVVRYFAHELQALR